MKRREKLVITLFTFLMLLSSFTNSLLVMASNTLEPELINEMSNDLSRSSSCTNKYNANGWSCENRNWYFRVGGVIQKGWLQRGSNWYFLDTTSGRMQTGWLQRGSNWYFLNPPRGGSGHNSSRPEGVMLTGWLQRGSNWYFLNPPVGVAGHNPNRPVGAWLP